MSQSPAEQQPHFLGTARKVGIVETTDTRYVGVRVEFVESPQEVPIEFVLTAQMSMGVLKMLQDLQQKYNWPAPTLHEKK